MAGLGSRFADAGFVLPKPLIPIDGVPMVVRALLDLPRATRVVFVVHAEHVRQFAIDNVLRQWVPNCRIVVAPGLTQGQACSVRLAAAELDADEQVLVAACDNTHLYDAAALAALTSQPETACLIWTYRNDSRVLIRPTAYGWVDVNGEVVRNVSVKVPISTDPLHDHAVTGTFWFRRAGEMVEAIDALVASEARVNNEFYLDSVPNVLISKKQTVRVFEVEKYIGWGTPADLEDYLRWSRYVANIRQQRVA
jgi:NDP-sugar pyrophosphorylase family protein